LNYEFFDYSWALPFWDEKFMNFWQTVPCKYKKKQSLYKQFSHKKNWGGVWREIPINAKKISPVWLYYLRNLSKVFCAPFGGDNWHKIDGRFFKYHSEVLGLYAQWRYRDLLKEKMLPKNILSWLSRDYLNKKGAEIFNAKS